MHKLHTIKNEVKIQSFWAESKMDAGYKRFDKNGALHRIPYA
jgi:hypothetical protein